MHYIIFGKFHTQNKPLDKNLKVFMWDKTSLVALFAQRYLQHKAPNNQHHKDVFFLEKVKVIKLESNQFEEDGDVIMLDSNKVQNFKYPEIEIHNTDLNTFCKKLQDTNIVIHLCNI